MTENDGIVVDPAARTITVERWVRVDLDRAWRAWTEPSTVELWWGPHGWTTVVHAMDVRPGGHWRLTMTPDTGTTPPMRTIATYRQVVPHATLSWTDASADETWAVTPGPEFATTVAFEAADGGTRVLVRADFRTDNDLRQALRFGMARGYAQALERLEELGNAGTPAENGETRNL
jgi:uncharacterized protein YndB with AHSA1/START domain